MKYQADYFYLFWADQFPCVTWDEGGPIVQASRTRLFWDLCQYTP